MILVFWMLNLFTLLIHFHQEALYFFLAFCHKDGVICISEVIDNSPGNLDSSLLHPAQHFSWCTLHMLSKQGDNIQSWCTPFPIWNQSIVACPVLTVASWLAYRFHRRQVRWSGILISLRIFYSLLIYTVKGFSIVNKAEVDVFLELSRFFDDPMDVGNLISGSSAFSKTSLNIWKFTVHVLLKPGLANKLLELVMLKITKSNFEHYFANMWDECNCSVAWAFFGVAFLWDWNENWPFPVLWPLLFSIFAGILSVALSQHHLSGFEIAQLEFHHFY